MNKLIEFLPPEISNIEDLKEIMDTETIELEIIEKGQKRILNENFIDTATEYGIRHQEKLFKIRADLSNETLEFRKLRIENRKIDKAPFTYRFLENKLNNLFGEDNYKLEVLNNEYVLKVEINTFDWNMFNEIVDNFRTIIPCNMILNSTLVQKIKSPVHVGACITTGEEIAVYPWMPKEISTKGKINIAMTGIGNIDTTTIYPRKEA